MRTLRQDGEEGAALILALILVTVVSLALLSLGSLVDTGIREASATGTQADRNYAADGAVDAAVNYVRDDFTLGNETPAKNCDYAVPDGTFPNVSGVTVACNPQSGSGLTSGGSGNPSNTPDLALLATATTETGLLVGGNLGASGQGLKVSGPVQSNSSAAAGAINVTGGTALTVTSGTTKTVGACSGAGTYSPACTTGSAAHVDYKLDPRWNHDALPTNTATVPGGCGGTTLDLSPGIYTSATALTALTAACSGQVLHFTPGTYLFNFPTGSSLWTIGPGSNVVGGQLSATPTVAGASCLDSASTPVGTAGVEFVFTGESRVTVNGGHLELCPKPNTTKQKIAFYGERSTTTTSTTTSTGSQGPLSPTAQNNGNGQAAFSNPANALVKDGAFATYAKSNGGPNATDGSLDLQSYGFSAIPAGSTITSAIATVTYKGSPSLASASATLKGAARTQSVPSSVSPCTPGTLCLDGALHTTDLPFTGFAAGDFTTATELGFAATSGSSSTSFSLDAATLSVAYSTTTTTTTTTGAAGCLTVAPYGALGSCALLSTSGNNSFVSLHGTLYAWDSAIDLQIPNSSAQVLGRGAVARVIKVTVPASLSYVGDLVSLPTNTPGSVADRDVVFVVSINGVRWVRARVKFTDDWSNLLLPSNTKADVMSWSTG